jgi:hypothetical protein
VLKSLKQLALPIFNDDFPCVTSIPSINQTWFAVSHPPAIVRWLPQRTKPPWFGISQPRLRTPPRGPTTELCFQVPARHLLNLGADSDLVQSHLKTVGFHQKCWIYRPNLWQFSWENVGLNHWIWG